MQLLRQHKSGQTIRTESSTWGQHRNYLLHQLEWNRGWFCTTVDININDLKHVSTSYHRNGEWVVTKSSRRDCSSGNSFAWSALNLIAFNRALRRVYAYAWTSATKKFWTNLMCFNRLVWNQAIPYYRFFSTGWRISMIRMKSSVYFNRVWHGSVPRRKSLIRWMPSNRPIPSESIRSRILSVN